MRTTALIMAAVLTLGITVTEAQIPRMISYQGVLTDTLDHPRPDGTYSFTFRLYGAASGGAALWSETKALALSKGLFSTMLGDQVILALPFSAPYWLSVQVGSEPELSPRFALTSSGYSLRSSNADTAQFAKSAPQQAFVDSARIAAGLPDNAVTSSKIADGSVTQAKLAGGLTLPPGGSAGGDLSGSFPNPLISSGAVTTGKLADNAVTAAKLSDGSVTLNKLADNVATTSKLADNAVTSAKLVDKAVTTAKLADGSVTQAKLSGSVTLPPGGMAGGDLSGTYPNPTINNGAITTSRIADGAVATTKLADGSVSDAKIHLPLNLSTNVGFGGVPMILLNTNVDFGGLPMIDISSKNNVGISASSVTTTAISVFGGVYGLEGNGSAGGVYGGSTNGFGVGGSSFNIGMYAHNFTAPAGRDAYLATPSLAADLFGNVVIHGQITKSSGSFRIDHPLDPANKYLSHSFVESPDMKNIYDGVAVLDAQGQATVTLPAWFEALNRDFRYQLTAIGTPGPDLYIAQEVSGNLFRIAGGAPGMKVSWQVTGIRQDAWANAHRIPVEEDKTPAERGFYEHPELFGQSESRSIQHAAHPDAEKMRGTGVGGSRVEEPEIKGR